MNINGHILYITRYIRIATALTSVVQLRRDYTSRSGVSVLNIRGTNVVLQTQASVPLVIMYSQLAPKISNSLK